MRAVPSLSINIKFYSIRAKSLLNLLKRLPKTRFRRTVPPFYDSDYRILLQPICITLLQISSSNLNIFLINRPNSFQIIRLNLTDPPEVNDLARPRTDCNWILRLTTRPRTKIFINCATHSSFANENPIEPNTKPNSRRRDMTSARCCCTALIWKRKNDNKMQPLRFTAVLNLDRFHGSSDPALKKILRPHLCSHSRHWIVNVDNIKLSLKLSRQRSSEN